MRSDGLKRALRAALVLIAVGVIAGCATPTDMGPRRADTALDVSKTSVLLMSVKLAHPVRPSATPNPIVVNVETPDAQSKEQRLNFRFDKDARFEAGGEVEYLVRMPLPAGQYVIRGVTGTGGFFPFPGFFFMPLHVDVSVEGGQIVYLGRVSANTRERQGEEFRAGPLLPLIDQAATGWSGATWEVTIIDDFDRDIERFRTLFPSLQKANVDKRVMPPFDRAKAQDFFNKN